MRLLGVTVIAAAAATLAACAGPADPSAAANPPVYRTGSLLPQPNVAQPNMTYYGQDQLARSPNWTVGGAIAHSVPTAVPPAPETAGQ
jgi:hypothetical protein